jgi:hypothetical protein
MPAIIVDRVGYLPENGGIIFAGEETMPNKSVVIFLIVLLTIIPGCAVLPEQPDSVPAGPNSLQSRIDNATKGDANAQFNLGVMYYKSEGVPQDYVEAYKWVFIAGLNGMDVTTFKRTLFAKMTPAQIDEAQKRAKEFIAKKEKANDSGSSGLK